ncbi:MAG: hypothetical protein HON47_04995 [Candidatus Diapherotrites archaeon]|uniref:Uncharacterized protein n=1 Tax=Candidatus Iainarchaeum sp. TaxID=3101447 RepID=A0A8T5GHB6_9ARCH|nr:hypothetical protein [Candidatus Diapherotrites archaeon]
MCFGLFKKKKKKEVKVCIPEHAKERIEREVLDKKVEKRKEKEEKIQNDFVIKKKIAGATNLFKVTGRYDTGNETALSGYVESGSIREKMKTNVNGNEIKVSEIRIGSNKIDELNFMEEGTIFVKGKNIQNIKYDDLLDFKL